MLKISKRQQMICNVVLSILELVWLAAHHFCSIEYFLKQSRNTIWEVSGSFRIVLQS